MAGPVNFLKGLVGASPSHSSDKVKSERVGRYGHRTAKAVDGEPIMSSSKEHFIAQAEKLEKQAGKFRSKVAKEVTLGKAHDMRALAEGAKTNAQLHAEERLDMERFAEIRRNPLDQVKSNQVEHHDHPKDADGRPILKESKEYLLDQAKSKEKQAAECKTTFEKELKLHEAHLLRTDARDAKTNAQLHTEKELEKAMPEKEIKKHRTPLDQIKKAAGKVADAVKHELEELRHGGAKSLSLFERTAKMADEKEVLDLLINKKDTLNWHKSPVESFDLWLDIRGQRAKVEKLEKIVKG